MHLEHNEDLGQYSQWDQREGKEAGRKRKDLKAVKGGGRHGGE